MDGGRGSCGGVQEACEPLIESAYRQACIRKSDINDHLHTLRALAEQCAHVTEFGVRTGRSTVAFLAAKPRRLASVDVNDCQETIDRLRPLVPKETEWKFVRENTLEMVIEETDLLFIDTIHTYAQIQRELWLHAWAANRFLVFHDTATFGMLGQGLKGKGIRPAIDEFLNSNKKWEIIAEHTHNNGLLILEKNA